MGIYGQRNVTLPVKLAVGFALGALLLPVAARTPRADSASPCQKTRLFRSRGVTVWTSPHDSHAIFYKSGFAVDADGAFEAYHPKSAFGLDALAHAGHRGDWWALVTTNGKKTGRPVIQGQFDPAPGYFVSTTALFDPDNPNIRDPHRYVDAAKIPYIVLHPWALKLAHLGDFATVVNLRNGKMASALVADKSSLHPRVGEGSIALAEELGINSDPRFGGQPGDVVYLIYSGSGNGRPRDLDDITTNAKLLLEAWGGVEKLTACVASK